MGLKAEYELEEEGEYVEDKNKGRIMIRRRLMWVVGRLVQLQLLHELASQDEARTRKEGKMNLCT
jgi:hypothetical protein